MSDFQVAIDEIKSLILTSPSREALINEIVRYVDNLDAKLPSGVDAIFYAGALFGAANTVFSAGNPLFTDFFLPFINYYRDGKDLVVANVFGLINLTAPGAEESGKFDAIKDLGLSGMRIKDFDFRATIFGEQLLDLDFKGDFGMAFKITNALYGVMALLPPIAGSSIFSFKSLADEAITLAAAAKRLAAALDWLSENDPLVLDLDGDGIETSALGTQGRDSDVHFGHDGDFFAEREVTGGGWHGICGANDNDLLACAA
jgi:hypothetical protein